MSILCGLLCFMVHMRTHFFLFFFFNDTATTEIYTLSLHDALPISCEFCHRPYRFDAADVEALFAQGPAGGSERSEEHTSELQSRLHLVCRLLLEKKKTQQSDARSDNRFGEPTARQHLHLCQVERTD